MTRAFLRSCHTLATHELSRRTKRRQSDSSSVVERFDHANLNLDPSFTHQVPTTENFCIEVYHLLAERFVHATLERVRVEETSNNFFEYAGKGKHGTPSSRS